MPIVIIVGNFKKRKRPNDNVLVPSTWVQLKRKTLHKHPFAAVYVKRPINDNGEHDATPVVDAFDFKVAYNNTKRSCKLVA